MMYVMPIVILALLIEHQTFDSVGKLCHACTISAEEDTKELESSITSPVDTMLPMRRLPWGMAFLNWDKRLLSPDAGVSPHCQDDSEPGGDGVKDDREVSVEQSENSPWKCELCMGRIVVLDRCVDRIGNVFDHDHEISDSQSCQDGIRGRQHFLSANNASGKKGEKKEKGNPRKRNV